jgi:hypothetical protein
MKLTNKVSYAQPTPMIVGCGIRSSGFMVGTQRKEMTMPIPVEYQKLSTEQLATAEALYAERPKVHPGTDVIIDDDERSEWCRRVKAEADALIASDDTRTRHRFYNVAGMVHTDTP